MHLDRFLMFVQKNNILLAFTVIHLSLANFAFAGGDTVESCRVKGKFISFVGQENRQTTGIRAHTNKEEYVIVKAEWLPTNMTNHKSEGQFRSSTCNTFVGKAATIEIRASNNAEIERIIEAAKNKEDIELQYYFCNDWGCSGSRWSVPQ